MSTAQEIGIVLLLVGFILECHGDTVANTTNTANIRIDRFYYSNGYNNSVIVARHFAVIFLMLKCHKDRYKD